MSIFNPIYETKKRKGLLGRRRSRKFNYHRYLETSAWKKLRNKIRRERKICERCGSSEDLQVHHKTYARVGAELLTDLELLCDACHKKHHHIGYKRRSTRRLGTNPRALGTNPRALGTNPRALREKAGVQ